MDIKGKKIAYITLGCKLNFSETSTIRRSLEAEGTISVAPEEEADIYVVNTCSVTDTAEKKCRQTIRKIAKRHPESRIIIVGCYAQLRAKELMKLEGVAAVLGTSEKFNIASRLKDLDKNERCTAYGCDIFSLEKFDLACSYGDRTRSFVKIQDGCDYFCSYCTIPYARGKSRSASISEILNVVKRLSEKGIKEIILTGVNTGDFGNKNESFLDLLKILEDTAYVERFRISSIEPNLLSDEIIGFVSASEHFMPHFHIPLQAGNDEVLKLMKRRYERRVFEEKVLKIRSLMPDAFIGVDMIAGMRGETEARFEDGYRFIENLPVSQLHVFPYSERAGTKAIDIPHTVEDAEKKRRVEYLLELSERKKDAFYAKYRGDIRPVLFESSETDGEIFGFTDNYIRVAAAFNPACINRICRVKLGETDKNGNMKSLELCL